MASCPCNSGLCVVGGPDLDSYRTPNWLPWHSGLPVCIQVPAGKEVEVESHDRGSDA